MRSIRPVAAVAVIAGLAVSSSAQMMVDWAAAVDGNWNDPLSWAGMAVPTNIDTPVLGLAGMYTATSTSTISHPAVMVTNPDATIVLRAGTQFNMTGTGLDSVGRVVIGDLSSNFGTVINLADGAMLSGELVFNPTGNAETRASIAASGTAGESAMFAPGTTLTGTGRLTGQRINSAGAINPDGNFVNFFTATFDQTLGGSITAVNGSTVRINNISVLGGSISIESGSSLTGGGPQLVDVDLSFDPGTLFAANAALTDGDVSGDPTVRAGQTVTVNPGVVFDPATNVTLGDLSSNFGTVLNLTDGASFRGDLIYNPTGNAETRAVLNVPSTAGESATLLPGTTVTGTGRVTGHTLNSAGAFNPDARIQNFFLTTLDQTSGGSITAINASSVGLNSVAILGGSISIESGSVLNGSAPALTGVDLSFEAGTLFAANAVLNGGSFAGDATVRAGQTVTVNPGVTFDPATTVTLGDMSSNFGTTLTLTDGASFRGDLIFNPTGNAETRAVLSVPNADGESATLLPGSTVTGTGRTTGRTLNSGGVYNPDGNIQTFFLTTLDQSSGGSMVIENGSTVGLNNTTVVGGSVSVETGSTLSAGSPNFMGVDVSFEAGTTLAANASFTGGALSGDVSVRAAQTITMNPGVNQDTTGLITLGDLSSNFGTVLNVAADAELSMPVMFNPTGNAEIRAVLSGPGAAPPAHMADGLPVSGTGRVTGAWADYPAHFAPGFVDDMGDEVAGLIRFLPAFATSMTDNTLVEIDLTTPTASDRIQTTAAVTLDGTMRVSDANGVVPAVNQNFTVVSGAYEGRFDTLDYTGSPPAGLTGRLFYDASQIIFAVVCEADFALPAGTINVFDILAFLDVWNNGFDGADYDGSGTVNIFDILAFLADWNAGCP